MDFRTPIFLASLVVSRSAFADTASTPDLPDSGFKGSQATSGVTNVTNDGKFQGAAKDDPKEIKHVQHATISAGGMIATGNSQSIAVTGAGKLRIRENDDAFSMQAAVNYGWSHNLGQPSQTTVENYQGLARYDRFISPDITGFFQVQARRDRFAGLDLRFQIDPGAGYYFVDDKVTKFWGELGYDFLYDIRYDPARLELNSDGTPYLLNGNEQFLPKTAVIHSARLFFGLNHLIRDGVKFEAAAEYLQCLTDISTFRINGNLAITVALSKQFSLSMSTLFRFDNAPLPGKQPIDTLTTAALVINIL